MGHYVPGVLQELVHLVESYITVHHDQMVSTDLNEDDRDDDDDIDDNDVDDDDDDDVHSLH